MDCWFVWSESISENKTEPSAKFLQFAFRALENQPRVKIRNGAAQLAYEALTGLNVEAWIEGRPFGLCFSGASDWNALNDSIASIDMMRLKHGGCT